MKRLLTLVGCVGMAFAANADLLFWQVNNSALSGIDGASDYSYAKIYFSSDNPPDTTGGAKNNYLDQDMSIAIGDTVYKTTLDSISGAYADIGSLGATANAFAIELYNSSGQAVANSGWITDNIADYIVSTAEFNSNWSSMTQSAGLGSSTTGWTSGAVPEPTSGLMLLVGMAMLGLRRRKVA